MLLAFESGSSHTWAMAPRKIPVACVSLAVFAASALSTYAASGEGPWHPTSFPEAVLATFVFGLMGIALAIIGFKLFDLVTPFNLEKEMCENKNVAVGILCGGIVLGICWIVAASMS
jgi:Domain of Unknown Function (DUF350)